MRALVLLSSVALCTLPATAARLLPWQRTVEVPVADQAKNLDSLFDLPFANSGGDEGKLTIEQTSSLAEQAPFQGRLFDFRVKIDHHNAGQYPIGWPSFEARPKPGYDLSGYDAIQYWIRCDTKVKGALPIRFILWTNGEARMNELLPAMKAGEWLQVTHRLSSFPDLAKADRIHFFLCESDYKHGDELAFKIGGFRLCNLRQELAPFAPGAAAMGLWVGDRADKNDDAVILDRGTKTLPGLMVFQTGDDVSLRASDSLRVRYHETFTGKETVKVAKLGQDIAGGKVSRVEAALDIAGLAPGYYLVTADVQRNGKSLLGGRVGCDDLYIRKPGESMTYTVLSLRTGMTMWVRDQLYGDVMCATRVALPHTYDPLDKATYARFIELFAYTSGKHTEGNEAGDTGIALAAEAFRKSGDMVRCKFTEWLLEDSLNHMMAKMQAPSGACITWTNELADNGIGTGGRSENFGQYDPNQMGEWMRALTYGIIYYSNIPEKRAYARKLSAACHKAADYLVAHAQQTSDGIPNVIRHVTMVEKPGGKVEQITYHQEGRQCDVYLGRALAGLSYYAYAMQLLGEKVPANWWPVLDNTTLFAAKKMKPNGWFDWQCEDIVEGGCHTFLGNIYIGEGTFGCYLADKMAGRTAAARDAAEATRRAYRYVTDDCWIRGKQYTPAGASEFWVGPYVYWLFTEYHDTIGPDEGLDGWLTALDKLWRVDRGWRDFIGRPCADPVGRSDGNGMLATSILGYNGIRQMEEIGKPLHWRVR